MDDIVIWWRQGIGTSMAAVTMRHSRLRVLRNAERARQQLGDAYRQHPAMAGSAIAGGRIARWIRPGHHPAGSLSAGRTASLGLEHTEVPERTEPGGRAAGQEPGGDGKARRRPWHGQRPRMAAVRHETPCRPDWRQERSFRWKRYRSAMVAAAKKNGLDFVVFLERFDLLTPEKLKRLKAKCAKAGDSQCLVLPGYTIDDNRNHSLMCSARSWNGQNDG